MWVCNKHIDRRLDVGSEVVVVECQEVVMNSLVFVA